jgi:uncharacterized membrane protein
MRLGSVLLVVGIAVIAVGVVWGWYYATQVFPSERAASEQRCQGPPPTPCPSLAPADGIGYSAFTVGFLLVLVGAILKFGTHPSPRPTDVR